MADQKMARAGVSPQERRAFLGNPWISPRHRTTISERIARLQGVANLGALAYAAAESRSEAQALLHEQQAAYLVRLQGGPDPVASPDATGGVVAAFTRSGAMHVPVPVDVIVMRPEVEAVTEALLAMPGASEAKTRVIWVPGRVSRRAFDYLRSRGFGVVQEP